jgi:hypothetical protein
MTSNFYYNSTESRPCNCRPPYAGGGAATGEHKNTDKGGTGRTALGAGPGSNSTEPESSSPEWQLPRLLEHDDTLAEPAAHPWPVAGALQRLRLDGPDCGGRASGEGLRMFTENARRLRMSWRGVGTDMGRGVLAGRARRDCCCSSCRYSLTCKDITYANAYANALRTSSLVLVTTSAVARWRRARWYDQRLRHSSASAPSSPDW